VVAGRYRLLSPLGAGGMGTVWRAEDEVLGRAVAVKEVTFPLGLSDEDRDVLRERTRREARAAARLEHPSAVTVFDVVEQDGIPYLVMELVEAQTLSQVVRADGPLPPERVAQIGLALLGALEAAHRQGIVHRDVKPGNVLLGPDDRVVLTDFGIASSPGDSSITTTGLLLGSPSYIAPERARGESPGAASDLWSLGATLFTAVEGAPPYDAGEPLLTVTAVVTGDHAPFVHAGPLEPVLAGLLEREPDRRMSSDTARRGLEAVLAQSPPVPPLPDATAALPLPGKPGPERTAAIDIDEVREATDPAPDEPTLATAVPAGAPPAAREPLPDPAAAELPPSDNRRSRLPLALAAVALLLGLGVLVLALAAPGTLSALDPRDAKAEPAASAGPAALPQGWVRYKDPDGWSVGVPAGYVQSDRGGQVQLRDEKTRRTLRVNDDVSLAGSALATWQAFSPELDGSLERYEELRVEARGDSSADLEFTFFDQTQLHVLYRLVVAGDRGYGLYWQIPESGWADGVQVFEQIAATFQPAP
jgi:hypothetical protein